MSLNLGVSSMHTVQCIPSYYKCIYVYVIYIAYMYIIYIMYIYVLCASIYRQCLRSVVFGLVKVSLQFTRLTVRTLVKRMVFV